MVQALKLYEQVAQTVASLLYPYGEVVIHDLKKGRIHQIYNSLSRRSIGELSSLELNHERLEEGKEASQPYEKLNWDGRRMKSVLSLLRDSEKNPIGLLCINLDISHFEGFQKFLKSFMEPLQTPQQANNPFYDNWQDRIQCFIQAYLKEKGLTLLSLTQEHKCQLIQGLEKKGAFRGKNAATLIGRSLNLSRATVYKYLSGKSVKKKLSLVL